MNDFTWKYAQEMQNAAFLNSQVACALVEMAAMQAHDRTSDTPYTEEAYSALIDKYGIGHNSALTTLRINT